MTHLRAVGLVVALSASSVGRAPLTGQATDEAALRREAEEFLAESRARPRRLS